MHHTINYEGLAPDIAETKALEDVKFYLSDQFEKMTKLLREEYEKEPYTFETFQNNIALFLGIRGVIPAKAFFKHCFPDLEVN